MCALVVLAAPLATADLTDSQHYAIDPFFEWHKADLDVLIVPPTHGPLIGPGQQPLPYGPEGALPTGTYLEATLAAIENWRYAIGLFAAADPANAWLAEIEIRSRVVAVDLVTPQEIAATDILIVYPEHGGLILGAATTASAPERKCIAANTLWLNAQSMNHYDMFKLAGHEFGHCLGLGHTVGNNPGSDMLSQGGYPNDHHRCPSNLDLMGIKQAFSRALIDEPGGQVAQIPRAQYAQYCMPGLS